MIWFWSGFLAFVAALMLLHRRMPATIRSAVYYSAAWMALGVSFAGFIYLMYKHAWLGATLAEPSDRPGADAAVMFLSAYILEVALAFDNILIIAMLFQAFRVPTKSRPQLLFWGLNASITFRLFTLVGGGCVASSFDGVLYLFGAYLAYQGIKLMKPDTQEVESHKSNLVSRMLGRFGPIVDGDHDGKLFVIRNGRRALTTVAVCAVAIVLADVVFALDSIAVLSVTKTMFIVVTSNVLATMGLRSLNSELVSRIAAFRYARTATAAMFLITGAKLLAHNQLHVPHTVLLALIVGILGVCIAASLLTSRQ